MYDKATRRYSMLILTMYLTYALGLSVVTATIETPSGRQVAEAPKGSASRTTHSTPKRDTIVTKSWYVRAEAKRWFLQREHLDEWKCIDEIIYRESRWIPNLHNKQGSSAYGLGQVKNSYKYTKNKPLAQFKRAVLYAIYRYGTLCNALKAHNKQGWY